MPASRTPPGCCSSPTAPRRRRRSVRARADGWRLGGRRAGSHWRMSVGGGEPVEVDVPAADVAITHRTAPGRFTIDQRGDWLLAHDGDVDWIGHNGYAWPVRRLSAAEAEARPDRRRAARADARAGAARAGRGRRHGLGRRSGGRARVDEDGAGADRADRRLGHRADRRARRPGEGRSAAGAGSGEAT